MLAYILVLSLANNICWVLLLHFIASILFIFLPHAVGLFALWSWESTFAFHQHCSTVVHMFYQGSPRMLHQGLPPALRIFLFFLF